MPFLKPQGQGVQTLHHYSVSWKITPLYFFSSNLTYFWQKEPIEVKFLDFWVVGWKFTKFLMSYLKPQVSFSLNFASLFSVMRDNSFVLFLLKLYIIWMKEHIKVQNFRLLTVHMKFHQTCPLIGSFCWKYTKLQWRYDSWHWRVMQNLKKNWFSVSKMTRIWWILTQALETLQN